MESAHGRLACVWTRNISDHLGNLFEPSSGMHAGNAWRMPHSTAANLRVCASQQGFVGSFPADCLRRYYVAQIFQLGFEKDTILHCGKQLVFPDQPVDHSLPDVRRVPRRRVRISGYHPDKHRHT